MKGKLIGIDGMNGVGKTTLIKGLKRHFPNAIFVKEPGETRLGVQIREILLNREEHIDPVAEFLLFAADHHQTFSKIINPALDEGRLVITDRTYLSSIAFQGALGVPLDLIHNVAEICCSYDKIFTLHASKETLKTRLSGRKLDHIESRDDLDLVQELYLRHSSNLLTTDNLTPEQTLEIIVDEILNELQKTH